MVVAGALEVVPPAPAGAAEPAGGAVVPAVAVVDPAGGVVAPAAGRDPAGGVAAPTVGLDPAGGAVTPVAGLMPPPRRPIVGSSKVAVCRSPFCCWGKRAVHFAADHPVDRPIVEALRL